jgi:uncharacterized protein YdeI (YjbR/CyaY-like superfamily)
MTTKISGGVAHRLPSDLRSILLADRKLLPIWESLTPLARNEWICLVDSAKLPETRLRRLERARSQLKEGKRRPCCWEGCPHR